MRIKQIFTVGFILIFGIAEAQNKYVASGEWFWDSDPGIGNGTLITAVDGNFDDAIEEVMLNSTNILALGEHTFSIRVQDATGAWGPLFTTIIDTWESAASAPSTNVSMAEYFWDTDPGEGSGTPMLAADGTLDDAVESIIESTMVNLPLGVHTLSVRVMDPNGSWGPLFTMVIDSWEPVVAQQDANVTMAEFFWDTDPGEGNGTPILATDGSFDEAVEAIMASSTNIPSTLGPHVLYVRSQEDEGNWGPTFATVVDVWADVATSRSSYVKGAEYFFDTDPGEGSATPILAQDGNFDQTLEAIIGGAIPAPVAQGIHVLYIRPMDEENAWGPTFGIVVNIDTTLGAPPFTTMMTGPDAICEHDLTDTYTYTATQNVGTSFTWTATGGTITSGAGTNEVEVSWDGVAPYSIKVVECDVTAVCDSVEFGINVLMPVIMNETAMICAGDSMFLEGAWQTIAGQYTDTFTGPNGCDSSIVTTLSINDLSASILTQQDVSCFGGSDGWVEITASAGTQPYVFDIGNGQQSSGIFSGLAAGVYTIEVTDDDGCTVDVVVTILEPSELIVQCSSTNGNCSNGNLGEGCANVSGGTQPYQFIWSDGQTTQCITDLIDGEYCVWVYDANGCVDSCCVMIENDPGYIIDQDLEMCDGDSIFLEGAWQFGADTYTDSYVTNGGCDSVINTTVSLLDIYFTQEVMNIAIGDSAYLENDWQHTAGLYYDTLEAANGCDSIIETELVIDPVGIIESSFGVEIYPNPVRSGQQVRVQFTEIVDELRIDVLDMSGRLAHTETQVNSKSALLDLDLATGIYRIQLIADEHEFGRKLMVR